MQLLHLPDPFVQRQHATVIFFDLKKAYDTTWKHGIIKDLYDAGLRGRWPLFIAGFLTDRQFKVRAGAGMYSKPYEQETGVSQGSILSVTAFCLKINSIIKELPASVTRSLYVDDFLICYRSKYIHLIERHSQQSLNKREHWANTNGFRFSSLKIVCMYNVFTSLTLLEKKYIKALNLLRVIANTSSGDDQSSLLHLYRA